MITNLSLNANAGLPRMLSVIGSGATCWVQNRFQVFFKWANPGLFFFIFVFSTVNSKYIQYKILPMTGFEPRISGLEATALPTELNTALFWTIFIFLFLNKRFKSSSLGGSGVSHLPGAVIVLIDSFEPSDIIVGVGNKMNVNHVRFCGRARFEPTRLTSGDHKTHKNYCS